MEIGNKNKLIIFIALIILTTIACSTLTGNNESNISIGQGQEYYTDFSDIDDWNIYSAYDEVFYALEATGDGLLISLVNPEDLIYGYLEDEYSNVIINAGFEMVEGDADITFEVICRSNDDGEYIFAFDLLGYYYVWYYNIANEEYEEIDFDDTSAIDDQYNEVSVSCIGDELDFYINGSLVSSIVDDKSQSGFVGFAIETYDEYTAEIVINHFEIFEE